MTALLVTNDFPPMAGGEATYYARICATLSPERVMVLAPRFPGDRSFDVGQAYRIIRRRVPVSPHPLARLLQIVLLSLHALRIARRERVHAVHIGHLWLGPIGLAVNRLLKVPYVIYLHGGDMAPYLRFRVVRAVVRTIVRHADVCVVNSAYTRRDYEAMGIHHPRVELLTMSVPLERFRPGLDPRAIRAKYRLDGQKVILTVGRLIERKGHDVVIRALSRIGGSLGSMRYVIAGRGPEEQRLRALARDLGCGEQVKFIGHVPDEDLPHLYAACDVFVMPSRALDRRDGVEGFGIAFVEAGACGKPVIGGRSGGIADAVVDGVTGILVNPTDVEALAAVLVRLLRNQDEAARLGAQGRQRAQALERAWTATVDRIWSATGRG